MDKYFSQRTILITVALAAVMLTTLYVADPRPPATPSYENTMVSGAAEQTGRAIEASQLTHGMPEPEDRETESVFDSARNLKRDAEVDDRVQVDADSALDDQFDKQTQDDAGLPAPSSENVMAEPVGEYADQINQAMIFRTAETEGTLPPEVAPDSHPPTGENVAPEPDGENAREVSQRALIERAKSEGYLIPDVAPDSHSPVAGNAATVPQGESADEVNQQALIDRAKSEGYVLP